MKPSWLRWAIPLALLVAMIFIFWVVPLSNEAAPIEVEFVKAGQSS